jgi:hypothetical protein
VTFYDDAELAAVAILRLAHSENDDGSSRSAEIHDVLYRLFEQHGANGIDALVLVLGRHLAAAFLTIAHEQQRPVEQLLDEWEMHKLTQPFEEDDDA